MPFIRAWLFSPVLSHTGAEYQRSYIFDVDILGIVNRVEKASIVV